MIKYGYNIFFEDLMNASKLFESSEAHKQRLHLKMTHQKLELKGNKARYDWIKPFDNIAIYASRQSWLRNPSINLTNSFDCIIKAFQNPVWEEWFGRLTILSEVEGQAKERLKQIKLLTSNRFTAGRTNI